MVFVKTRRVAAFGQRLATVTVAEPVRRPASHGLIVSRGCDSPHRGGQRLVDKSYFGVTRFATNEFRPPHHPPNFSRPAHIAPAPPALRSSSDRNIMCDLESKEEAR